MGSFQYYDGDSWENVPDAAKPDDERGSIALEYPAGPGRDGAGLPCAAIGQPRIVIKFGSMTGTGMAFWTGLFATATTLYVSSFQCTAFDPRLSEWVACTGTLLRPTYAAVQPADTQSRTWYRDGEIVIENVTVSES